MKTDESQDTIIMNFGKFFVIAFGSGSRKFGIFRLRHLYYRIIAKELQLIILHTFSTILLVIAKIFILTNYK